MSVESLKDRIDLVRRLAARLPFYNTNDIPPPAGAEQVRLDARGVAQEWRRFVPAAAGRPAGTHYYNLYVHIPFCRSKCYYCIYDSVKLRSQEEVDRYLDSLSSELELFAPVFEGTEFQNVHVGGGTPTVLTEDQMRRIFAVLFGRYAFDDKASRVIECNPDGITPGKAELMKDFGFNKISLGVQSLDRDVLRKVNRKYQTTGSVEKAVRTLKRSGHRSINCDLMVGLIGDTGPTFLRSLKRLMGMEPSTVMVAKVQPPVHYLRKYFGGDYGRYVRFYDEQYRDAVLEMFRVAPSCGYEIDNPFVNELGWRLWRKGYMPSYDVERPYYCTGGELPSSCLGVGRFARSRIFGRLVYRREEGGGPGGEFRGMRVDERYEVLRHVFSRISKNRSLSRAAFEKIYGRPLEAYFGPLLEELEKTGIVREEGDELRFVSGDTLDLFVHSRLFLDRPTLLSSLAAVDRERIDVKLGERAITFHVEHRRGGEDYAAVSGPLGLSLQEGGEEEEGDPVRELVVKFMSEGLRRTVRGREGISAREVARRLAEKAPALQRILPPDVDFSVTVKEEG